MIRILKHSRVFFFQLLIRHVFAKVYRERERERERDRSIPNINELTTRTVTMSRDQQDGHGFGICVKGGKDAGK